MWQQDRASDDPSVPSEAQLRHSMPAQHPAARADASPAAAHSKPSQRPRRWQLPRIRRAPARRQPAQPVPPYCEI
eukprot:1253594-Prymnesium_polylepis.1